MADTTGSDVAKRQRSRVALRDVTLRDGLQDEPVVATDDKVALFESLVAAGITDLELASFVRPDRVPAMADAAVLAARTAGNPGVRRWGLVLNERGATRALEAGITHLQYVISVSETHQGRNAGRTVGDSYSELRRIIDLAASGPDSVLVELTLATAFGCPYEGPVPRRAVVERVRAGADAGVDGISLADTIGTAVPTEVAGLVAAIRSTNLGVPVGVHLHDTRGLGIANALAAIAEGAARLDGTVGGLGGCPFAPGASGNIALEDLAHGLEEMDIETGLDVSRLIGSARMACALVGKQVTSHVGVAGPRFARPAGEGGQT